MMIERLFSFLQPRSLQQRTALYTLLPTLLILIVIGVISLRLARNILLEQWSQTTIAKLHRTVSELDAKLRQPKRLLHLYQNKTGEEMNRHVSQFLLSRLGDMPGVIKVSLNWQGHQSVILDKTKKYRPITATMGGMRYHRAGKLSVSSPRYDSDVDGQTISLASTFQDLENTTLGKIEVQISFAELTQQLNDDLWQQASRALLVDNSGAVLFQAGPAKSSKEFDHTKIFGHASLLEQKTLASLQINEYGTILGPGTPPKEVSGYYHLREAPWTLVVISSADSALGLVISYRQYYLTISIIGICLVLLLIRYSMTGTTRAISRVSAAAGDLASGHFGAPLTVTGRDEVAELTTNFNLMSNQLKERLELQQDMNIAREVQQNLLPSKSYVSPGLDISGSSVYCQETGGDYFDVLPGVSDLHPVTLVVGDVVGHGIGAALMMATIRAIIRSRTSMAGTPGEIINDVNHLLCQDTEHSGNFITLFYLDINVHEKTLHWVRCGHEPAMIYCQATGEFRELRGNGIVLGIDRNYNYQENVISYDCQPQLVMLASDGLWEAENEYGERFGKDRLKTLLAENCSRQAQEIVETVIGAVSEFRGKTEQHDDITLVIAKAE